MTGRGKPEDGDFLGRWARRKQAAQEEAREGAEKDVAVATSEPEREETPARDERGDEEILEELGLKHPDDLAPGDDVSGYMQAAAPDHLRRLALRKLWRANPALANLDGLIDYGDDFTDRATVIENLQTVYEVGRGMVRRVEAALAEAGETAPEEERGAEPEPPEPPEPAPDAVVEAQESCAPGAPETPAAGPEPEPVFAPARRRMTFAFDES